MNGDPFDPVEVDECAPPLTDAEEWLIPQRRLHRRMVKLRVPPLTALRSPKVRD